MDAHGGQVVEDNRQIAIDQGPDLTGQLSLYAINIVHQGVHGAQEMVMLDLGRHLGHGHGVEPAQAPQLAGRVAQAVEDHRPHQRLDIQLALAGSKSAAEGAVKAEIPP